MELDDHEEREELDDHAGWPSSMTSSALWVRRVDSTVRRGVATPCVEAAVQVETMSVKMNSLWRLVVEGEHFH